MSRPTIIHIHIPKTAGTTLNALVGQVLGSHVGFTSALPGDVRKLAAMPLDERDKMDFVFGHFPYGLHRLFRQPVLYITCVREPRRRILSLYRYVLSRPEHPLHNVVRQGSDDFSSFLTLALHDTDVQDAVDNLQMRMISGEMSLDGDYGVRFASAMANMVSDDFLVGDNSNLGAFLSRLSSHLKLKVGMPARLNATEGRSFDGEMRRLKADALELLSKFTKWDRVLYAVAKRVAHSRGPSSENPEHTIDLLYRAVLRRTPDEAGREEYSRLLRDGSTEVDIIQSLFMSTEFASMKLVSAAPDVAPCSCQADPC